MRKSKGAARVIISVALLALLGAAVASPAGAVTITGSITATDSAHPNFLNQTTTGSCATPNAASVALAQLQTHYDTHTLFNQGASPSCVTVAYTATNNVFIAAYSPSFNPASLSQNFLGSTSASSNCGGTAGSFSFNVPTGATFVLVVEECSAGAGVASYTLNVTGTGVVLAARFGSLSASATARGTLVRWRTASEVDVLGFNVYRQVNGRRMRVNKRVIPAANLASGRSYSYLDRTAPRGKAARYWIQAVDLDGSHSWYGPARVLRR